MNFKSFKQAVAQSFATLKQYPVVRTDVTGDEMWETYLAAFPAGTNPIFRERSEHDCSCCKQFIRNMGNVCFIMPTGKLVSLWEVTIPNEPEYTTVAAAMAAKALSKPIDNFFLHYERSVGTDKNFEELLDKSVKTWEHFHITLPSELVVSKGNLATKLGNLRSKTEVFIRGLQTITDDAIATVLELIAQNSLYRGTEFKPVIEQFARAKKEWANSIYVQGSGWYLSTKVSPSTLGIRNSAIGTLLIDLSEGMELEHAVKRFETMVAPANYKRPTALVTKSMVESAKKKIDELGLTSALQRRYATIDDITINNVLFADRTTKKTLSGDVFDELATKSDKPKSLDRLEEISIQNFIDNVLPTTKSIELMVENSHINNFVSLVAPEDPTANKLFKWDNGFSWSYNGDYADSIKERVKAAGGNVTGDLCCRLAWFNSDDLDLHMYEPNGYRIHYSNRRELSPCGGMLDVDANGGDGIRENPVENIFYAKESTMRAGTYKLVVHNYNRRRSDNVGFEAEIDYKGEVYRFAYDKMVSDGQTITIAEFKYHPKTGIEIINGLPASTSRVSKEVWGVSTNTFVPVKTIMLSPNFWDDQTIGNKHWFFMLEGCKNEGVARGFFNEFLVEDLNAHRKVIEMVGAKMNTGQSEQQLSGLGFSSTQRNSVVARITGAYSRLVRITF